MTEAVNEELEWLKGVVSRWYRPVIIAVLAVVSALYIYRSIGARKNAKLEQAAQLLHRVHEKFQEVQEPTTRDDKEIPEEAEARRKSLSDTILLLQDSPEPYRSYGVLYEAALLQQDGKESESIAELAMLPKWQEVRDAESVNRFVAELGALAKARQELGAETSLVEARQALLELARNGRYLASPAGLILERLAKSDAERQEVLLALEGIVARYPEQGQILEDAIGRLKG